MRRVVLLVSVWTLVSQVVLKQHYQCFSVQKMAKPVSTSAMYEHGCISIV